MILRGDALDLPVAENSIASVVCDPPYGLAFMGKEWDTHSPADFERWCEAWGREALRVLKPGGHLLAFGGTRMFHRLTCGLEDAGFEIRDCLSWLYGSGFPKSHNLDGDRKGYGTALKPAWEPIILARKPLAGTVAANVQEHGTGALNVDGCRIGIAADDPVRTAVFHCNGERRVFGAFAADGTGEASPMLRNEAGRWPANLCLDEESAALLDQQSGELSAGSHPAARNVNSTFTAHAQGVTGAARKTDGGGASRFFYCAKASRSEREAGLREAGTHRLGAGIGEGKDPDAPSVGRNTHPTVKPLSLMRWLVRLVTPPGGIVLDPFAGSGSTLCAAALEGFDAIGIELEAEYLPIARARLRHYQSAPAQLGFTEFRRGFDHDIGGWTLEAQERGE